MNDKYRKSKPVDIVYDIYGESGESCCGGVEEDEPVINLKICKFENLKMWRCGNVETLMVIYIETDCVAELGKCL